MLQRSSVNIMDIGEAQIIGACLDPHARPSIDQLQLAIGKVMNLAAGQTPIGMNLNDMEVRVSAITLSDDAGIALALGVSMTRRGECLYTTSFQISAEDAAQIGTAFKGFLDLAKLERDSGG